MKAIKIFERNLSPWYCDMLLTSFRRAHYPMPVGLTTLHLFLRTKAQTEFWISRVEYNKFLIELSKIYATQAALNKFLREFHKAGRRAVATSRRLPTVGDKVSLNQLVSVYTRFYAAYAGFMPFQWVSYYLNEQIAELASGIINKSTLLSENTGGITRALLSPLRSVGLLRLQHELEMIRKRNTTIPAIRAQELAQSYAWVPSFDISDQIWGVENIYEYNSSLVSSMRVMSYQSAVRIAKLNLTQRRIIERLRLLTYIKDLRDVYRRKAMSLAYPFLDQVARKIGLNRKQLALCTNQEIIQTLQAGGTVPTAVLAERKKQWICKLYKGQSIINSNLRTAAKYRHQFCETRGRSVMGQTANVGCVSGRVRIVHTKQDLAKVRKGNILVAATTHPDYLPAMQRAAAFVTDEGSLLSHAAIVARELGKPCIVGTKDASRVLRNGEHVKVDANRGIVKKL